MKDADRDLSKVGDLLRHVLDRLDSSGVGPSGTPPLGLSEALEDLQANLEEIGPRRSVDDFAELLRGFHGTDVDPEISLESPPDSSEETDGPSAQLFQTLASGTSSARRYRFVDELGRGGMGIVVRVWDSHLRRTLALKLSRQASGSASALAGLLSRFLEEAQVAAQLDHPGILPVYDLGVDAHGRPYFTMQLVRGKSARDVFEEVHTGTAAGTGEWTLARAVGVLLRIAETMAYAHSKRVIHRDLKPSNVMVGRFGEVYVMDWGLAKLLSDDDQACDKSDFISSVRGEERGLEGSATPYATSAGTVIGTPAYMAPEQATGSLDRIDQRADVYALGAMLYQLLVGAPPYEDQVRAGSNRTALAQAGPPPPVAQLAPEAPPELIAICEHAMEREPSDRYRDMQSVGDDLRAWLEGRVVSVYEGGTWAELKKWIGRNRALTGAVAAGVLVLVGGVVTSTVGFVRAKERADDVFRLSAIQDLEQLKERANKLWPPHPELLPELRDWVRAADELLARRPVLEARLLALRALETPPTEAQTRVAREAHPKFSELAIARSQLAERIAGEDFRPSDAGQKSFEISDAAWIERQQDIIADLEREIERVVPWTFSRREDQWWHDQLETLITDLDRLADAEDGILYGRDSESGPGVEQRIAMAERLRDLAARPDTVARWRDACDSISDPDDCPDYDGLVIQPQVGLVPLRRNPRTEFWEFWHVLSGDEPETDPDGKVRVTDQTGIVFVLVPGGEYTIGSQGLNPSQPHFDPHTVGFETPMHSIELAPYFLAKHEVTQAQWKRLCGTAPSLYTIATRDLGEGQPAGPTHPVEQVSWTQAERGLAWFGLTLPTEAQWETATRAGTKTPWWSGNKQKTLQGGENVADLTSARLYTGLTDTAPDIDDGFLVHAPVDAVKPNPWGFYHTLGNVTEWCQDRYGFYVDKTVKPGTGERVVGPEQPLRMTRGGSFITAPREARAAMRKPFNPGSAMAIHGVRAARLVQ